MRVLGDRDMLERVVVNLVGNAVKFTADGGLVAVRLDVDTGRTSLLVSDTGIGVPVDRAGAAVHPVLPLLPRDGKGDPRQRAGARNCQAIVEAHGGDVALDSQPGIGSTFRVALLSVVEVPRARNGESPRTRGM